MSEIPVAPKKQHEVGQSRRTIVTGMQNPDLVLKTPLAEIADLHFKTPKEAIDAIQGARKDRQDLKDEITKRGSPDKVIPEEEYFIAKSPTSENITFIRSQKWLKGAKPLSETDMRHLSRQNLMDLKNILIANKNLYLKEGKVHDIVGSTKKQLPFWKRVARYVFPLSFSENIMVDSGGDVRMIDTGTFEFARMGIKSKIRNTLQTLGIFLSLLQIDLLLATAALRQPKKEPQGQLSPKH